VKLLLANDTNGTNIVDNCGINNGIKVPSHELKIIYVFKEIKWYYAVESFKG
jgi:hypothetical protein